MGSQNVTAVFSNWAHLDHRPFRLLVGMAHRSLDEGKDGKPPRVYYAGRETTAGLLGYTLETRKAQATAYREVQKVIRQLIGVGALTHLAGPSERSHARYGVNVDGPPVGWASGTPVTGGRQAHPTQRAEQVGLKGPNRWASRASTGGPEGSAVGWASGTPIGQGTYIEETREEESPACVTREPSRARGNAIEGNVLDGEIVEDLPPLTGALADLFGTARPTEPETRMCSECISTVDLWAITRHEGRWVCLDCQGRIKATSTDEEDPW